MVRTPGVLSASGMSSPLRILTNSEPQAAKALNALGQYGPERQRGVSGGVGAHTGPSLR
jgi:hypothetical protein